VPLTVRAHQRAPASASELLYVDDRPGKFLCRVDPTIADDFNTRCPAVAHLMATASGLLSISN
jgi:hypothetical protein